MSVQINLPANLRPHAEGVSRFVLDDNQHHQGQVTLRHALEGLVAAHPDLRNHVLDADCELLAFVNVFVQGTSYRDLGGLDTQLGPDAEILIVTALAGG